MKKILEEFIPVILGALILTCIAFYNGFPLVYSDTGTYIHSGVEKIIPFDRPITYGLFLFFFSMKTSLWFVVIIQNIITSYLIFLLFRKLELNKRYFFIGILFLTFCSSIGWYSNQLMPDFFAPIVLLAILLLLYYKFNTWNTFFISLILIFGLITHFSHMLMGSFMIVFYLFLRYIPKVNVTQYITLKRLLIVGGLVFSSWIILPVINYSVENKFILSKGSHVFLTAHLNDKGVLYPLLKKYCDTEKLEGCKICEFKEELPTSIDDFIWKGEFFTEIGGWENSKEDFDKIISLSLRDPRFFVSNVLKSFLSGTRQLAYLNVGEGLTAYNEGSAPYGQVHWRFRNELNDYLNSKQNKYNGVNLNFEFLTMIQWIVIFLSLISVVYFYSDSRVSKPAIYFLTFILIGLLVNALCTAGLSSPYERYQSRVIWLLPLMIFCYWSDTVKDKWLK